MTRRVRILDARYNVPLHLLGLPHIETDWYAQPPVHIHYHWRLNPEHREETLGLLRRLGVPNDRLRWIVAQLIVGRPHLLRRVSTPEKRMDG